MVSKKCELKYKTTKVVSCKIMKQNIMANWKVRDPRNQINVSLERG